jgi:hypothetical protein
MTKSETPDEQPKKKVAKQVVTPKRAYFVPRYNRTVEAESAEEAGKLAKDEDKKTKDGDA